jgi:thioredoxin reductase (NADPH)
MYDTVIIGSGPAGLSAAVYAQRAQLDCVVVEKDYLGTGQIAETEQIDNYLGLPGENGYDLGERFREHAEKLGVKFLEAEVTGLVKTGNGWNVLFAGQEPLETRTVIYAAGASHRKLNISGEEEFSGRGVSYCAICDGAFYAGKTVAVIGGGDTALGDALYLSKIANKVYLIHRRDKFRANAALQKQVREAKNIEFVLCAVPVEIVGENGVTALKIQQDGVNKALQTDSVFVAVGMLPNTDILQGVVELDANGYIVAGEDGKTSAEGLLAAGDVRTKQLRQVVTAVADGANCVASVCIEAERNL